MRMNQPVTNKEVEFRDEVMIVSKTDLKGQLTYINRDFLEISGFTEAELIGQPHNIVRHPDMPVEAFEDLWRTLKAGRPWTGMVKNRCKNGDYYWVAANVAPSVDAGQVSGYLSVRRRPSRQQVEAAEAVQRPAEGELTEGVVLPAKSCFLTRQQPVSSKLETYEIGAGSLLGCNPCK